MNKTKDDYPMVLTVNEIMEILQIGKRVAYELMNDKDFPCVTIGKRLKRVNRDDFFNWFSKRAEMYK